MNIKNSALSFIGAQYKKHKQKANDTSLEHCLNATEKMLSKARYGFLITQGKSGWCNSRLVAPFLDKKSKRSFSLWFGTARDSRKAEELWSNPNVTLAFENKKEDANLIIYGKAIIETDPTVKKHYWKTLLQVFFPNGPLADDYVVVRIEPHRIEILNFKRNIIPEPFGLKPAVLVNKQNQWQLESRT